MLTVLKAPFAPNIAQLMKLIGSKKRSVYVSYDPDCHSRRLYSYWDDGSRSLYYVLQNGQFIYPPVSGAPGFMKEAGPYNPQVGDILIEHGTSQGKEIVPHFTFYGVQS